MTGNRWTPADLRNRFDETLDAFAFQFFGVEEFKSLSSAERLRILKAVKTDMANRYSYEWMIREK